MAENQSVKQIYSVSDCVSDDFANWIDDWQHNGFWFFDSPEIMARLAVKHGVDLSTMKLFFFRVHECQWNDEAAKWELFEPDESLQTNVLLPASSVFEGYDIVTHTYGTMAECSPLSCNHMAEKIRVNSNCLLDSLEEAKTLIETGAFHQCEPGPYRIFAVYSL